MCCHLVTTSLDSGARGSHGVCTGSALTWHGVCAGCALALHGVCTIAHWVCTGSALGSHEIFFTRVLPRDEVVLTYVKEY